MPSEELDKQLKHLAIVAQRHPPLSMERRQALAKLVQVILRSGKLRPPRKGKFYEDIYDEATQNLLLYVCENIERYNPERAPFMNWIRMLLYTDFFKKAFSEFTDKPVIQLAKIYDYNNLVENIYLPEQPPLLSEKLRECIEADPDNLFKAAYIKPHTEANFQNLLKRRLSGESWEIISFDLRIKVSTLSSFYQRCIEKFAIKFQEYLFQ